MLLLVTLALIVGLVAALLLARGRVSLHAAPATTSMGGGLPAGPVTPADIEGVRFDTVVRGYRMDQVDEVLERLESELIAAHDEAEGRVAGEAVARNDLAIALGFGLVDIGVAVMLETGFGGGGSRSRNSGGGGGDKQRAHR